MGRAEADDENEQGVEHPVDRLLHLLRPAFDLGKPDDRAEQETEAQGQIAGRQFRELGGKAVDQEHHQRARHPGGEHGFRIEKIVHGPPPVLVGPRRCTSPAGTRLPDGDLSGSTGPVLAGAATAGQCALSERRNKGTRP